jgi:uncharacterized membrane protein (UPF0127 family)
MHPDERNMAVAIEQLRCPALTSECLNPHFYAYGQLPLYIAYAGIQALHLVSGIPASTPSFEEATLALRILSALSSIALAFFMLKILKRIVSPSHHLNPLFLTASTCLLIFQPYAIQFAHFGTTESLLMALYTALIYYAIVIADRKHIKKRYGVVLGIIMGLALGTKSSSLPFFVVPVLALAMNAWKNKRFPLRVVVIFIAITGITTILSSPQSFLHWNDFMSSMGYESSVGFGTYRAFYTRQFEQSVPLLFQLNSILPYTLGWPVVLFGLLGFVALSWKSKENAILRIALIIIFIPNAFVYAKWTRFLAPTFPIFTLFALLALHRCCIHPLKLWKRVGWMVFLIAMVPGVAYLSVYTTPDVRFTASEWIYRNVPPNSKILSETANVIDIPVPPPTYKKTIPTYYVSAFNFYDLDSSPELQTALSSALSQADYILIPSRRIFKNHPMATYPLVAQYYDGLFSGKNGFTQVGELSSFPRISLLGRTIWEWNDEDAEETWTVFDHPVIRIYKKIGGGASLRNAIDISNYKTVSYLLHGIHYRLLVADTPEKWEQGLMYVRSKTDINGLDGMIFKFPTSETRMFWNKNTVSNLTLYWINEGGIIGTSLLPSIQNSAAIKTVSSPSPADTVIELIEP